MSINDWLISKRYWIRGGIIGCIISVVLISMYIALICLTLILDGMIFNSHPENWWLLIVFIIKTFFIVALIGIFIGSSIGWVIGKIESK